MSTGDIPGGDSARPLKPPYIEAFECLAHGREDQIEAFVAYGLFISSEYAWASKRPQWPTEEATRESFQRLLYDHEVQRMHDAAKRIVDDHREKLVREHEKKYLEGLFQGLFQLIEQKVQQMVTSASRRHFLRGVAEATTGGFLWLVILGAIIGVMRLFGVDLLHGLLAVSSH